MKSLFACIFMRYNFELATTSPPWLNPQISTSNIFAKSLLGLSDSVILDIPGMGRYHTSRTDLQRETRRKTLKPGCRTNTVLPVLSMGKAMSSSAFYLVASKMILTLDSAAVGPVGPVLSFPSWGLAPLSLARRSPGPHAHRHVAVLVW